MKKVTVPKSDWKNNLPIRLEMNALLPVVKNNFNHIKQHVISSSIMEDTTKVQKTIPLEMKIMPHEG